MGRDIIHTPQAPKPVGPYSQAVQLESDLLFMSGQLGIDPETGELKEDIVYQTRQALDNLHSILIAAGGTMSSVLKTTVFLKDMNDFIAMNEVYALFFNENPPARSCVQVGALPLDALVEIECIARV